MTSLVPASIIIGGVLPTSLRAAFARAIAEQGVGIDFGDGGLLPTEALTLIDEAVRLTEPLRLYGAVATNGQFPMLEAFLRTHGLAYQRTSNAGSDSRTVLFDGTKVVERAADERGRVAVTYHEIEQATVVGKLGELLDELRLAEEGPPPLTECGASAVSLSGAQSVSLAA